MWIVRCTMYNIHPIEVHNQLHNYLYVYTRSQLEYAFHSRAYIVRCGMYFVYTGEECIKYNLLCIIF